MKVILQQANQYVLRFDRGEEIVSTLKQFCGQEQIGSGFFHGLGACSYLKLAFYNLETKKYQEQEFSKDLEIAGVTGNIAAFENELIIHMHGIFADDSMHAIAGHVTSMKTAGTCEIFLTKFDQPMVRKPDPDTGLKLLE